MDTASTILLSIVALYLIIRIFGVLSRLGIKQLSARELDQKKGMMILDVRTNKEYEQGHIPGSVHVQLSEIGDKVKKLKKDKELVVYCQNGNRGIWAIKRLMGMGYKNLYNLKGGYNAWKRIHP
ncbi:MAG TPA: rhodanese-like domain-containing protein [Nitrospirota bacterium]|nr:rhodanese-like domain-containing protein [Nitrospirota bacterium]